MKSINKQSPAKINLFLHIIGKRPDGYHNLQTVFRLINLYDNLTFIQNEQPIANQFPIILKNAEHISQNPADNLIVKAGLALLNFAKTHKNFSENQLNHLPIIEIILDKKIPMGAGLGGGSSNCATTLMTLNDIWQLRLTQTELCQIGATLGADVPIFIFGKDAIAEGIGDILTPIDLPKQRFLLLMPNEHINTKQLFANPNLQRDCQIFDHDFLQQHCAEYLDNLSPNFGNAFEPVVKNLSNSVNDALVYLAVLAKQTHTTPRMTGSGSCVFLPIPDNFDQTELCQTPPCAYLWVESL